jgi:hypothetical protein
MQRRRGWRILVTAVALAACSSGDEEQVGVTMGTPGAACYPNDTCNDGLVCADRVCVVGEDDGASAVFRGSSGQKPTGGSGGAAGAGVITGGTGAGDGTGGAAGGVLIGGAPGTGGGFVGCQALASPARPPPVDAFLLVDKSTSMDEPIGTPSVTLWDATVGGIQVFVQHPDAAGTGVALQYFGLPDACDPDAYAIPAVPMAPLPSGIAEIVASTNAHSPSTLTPTAPALQGALRYLEPWAASHPGRTAAVVLITDGFPTQCGVQCSANQECVGNDCSGGMCSPNSIAEIAALASRLASASTPVLTTTLAIGLGLANLAQIATAGNPMGHAASVEEGDVTQAITDALLAITRVPLGCELLLPETDLLDPSLVALFYRDASGAAEEIPSLAGAYACDDNAGEGWYYDYAVQPSRMHLCPETCRRFVPDRAEIRLGCHARRG